MSAAGAARPPRRRPIHGQRFRAKRNRGPVIDGIGDKADFAQKRVPSKARNAAPLAREIAAATGYLKSAGLSRSSDTQGNSRGNGIQLGIRNYAQAPDEPAIRN